MIEAIRKIPKTGKWEFDYKDLKGKRHTKKGFKTKAEAKAAQKKFNEETEKGLCPTNPKMTFKEAGEMFTRLHIEVNCKHSTIIGYKGYFKNHLYPFFGDIKLDEITPILVKEFIKEKVETGRTNSTVNKYIKLMREVYSFMIDNGVISRNPLARIKALKETKNDKIRALSTEEVQALLNKTKVVYPDFYPLLFTAIFTGMRQGELLGLTWDSINWIKMKIKVDKNYTHGRVGTTKTNQIRYVDISKELARILKEWRLACPNGEYNLVFPNNQGQYQDAQNMLKRRFKPSLQRAGIDDIRFHDLRHTYASLLLAQGAPMKYVQHQLGHASITMTMDLYTHMLPEVNEQCACLIDNIIKIQSDKESKVREFGT